MRAAIIGCGRTGAALAEALDGSGHDVTIIDMRTHAFDRLPPTFSGNAVRGDGTDEDVLRRAGVEGVDLFFAITDGDNRNLLAAQLARDSLKATRVVAKVNDPVRAAAYGDLGVITVCRTTLIVDAIYDALSLENPAENAFALGLAGSTNDRRGV